MIVIDNERIIPYDCDDTLVMWSKELTDKAVEFDYYGNKEMLMPHEGHVRLLKAHKERGYRVIVWSAAGYKWAEEVVKKLGLTTYVDFVMTKPVGYIDDVNVEDWIGKRIYLPYEQRKAVYATDVSKTSAVTSDIGNGSGCNYLPFNNEE